MMRTAAWHVGLGLGWLLPLVLGLSSCGTPAPLSAEPPPQVRFLVTFDDGPSARTDFNSTLSILDQLATNDVQPHVCAVFFTQPVHPCGGGTPVGRAVMQRIAEQGHVLGLHSVSPRGHVAHHTIPTNDLVVLLLKAKLILRDISGTEPVLVRPPYGTYTPVTRAIYQQLGLHMLMADIRAKDGIIYGYNGSLTRRSHIHAALDHIKKRLERQVPGAKPYTVVMQFHDLNPYTARHMTDYLHILTEEARCVGLGLPEKPFYDIYTETLEAAIQRSLPPGVDPHAD